MRKLLAYMMGIAMVGALFTMTRPVAAAPTRVDQMVTVALSGAEEVPDPGDPDGTGTATVTFKSGSGEVCWDMKVSNITLPSIGAHIHEGARGVAGPVAVPLSAPDANGVATGCTKPDAALMTRIMQNPENFYINVHSTDFPAGAVRGQLTTLTDVETVSAPATTPAESAPAAAPAMLPNTGAESGRLNVLAGFALVVVAVGFSLIISARRRTTSG